MTIKSKMDLVYSARFLNLLRLPFDEWKAFDDGIIDNKGNIKKRNVRSEDWTKFHQLVANIKRLLRTDSAAKLSTIWLAYKTIKEEYDIESPELFIEYPIFEDMVSGDAGGNPGNIAAGTNSGAAVYPGPKTLNKKKRKRKMNEVKGFKQFITDRATARIEEAQQEQERQEKMNEVHTYSFKAFGANSIVIEASEVEVKSIEINGSSANKNIVKDELAEAFKELGVDGALTLMKEATNLVWKKI